jgi:hypothetical protein
VQDLTDRQPVTDHRQHGLIPSLGDAPDKVVASGNITLADYAKAWIRERNIKPRTRIGYEVLASAGTSTPPLAGTGSTALLVRAVHRDGVPDELRRLRTRHTLRFQFGVDVPDGAYVRAWLPAEAEIESTGAREISVVAPFMRDGDHLIRRANHPVFREHRQKLVIQAVGVSDACRQHYGCRGGENGMERIHSHG